jgi:hypothetical protein
MISKSETLAAERAAAAAVHPCRNIRRILTATD